MAQVSGSVRVFVLLALFLLKVTLAVRDPLNDPSLEIIRQQDAEEGLTQGYQDPNAIPCRDPTPVNGALEVVTGIPFLINSIVVKLKCLNGLVFPDGTTEKTERCFGAPTPFRMTGIWSPDQEIFVCQETLLCANPKTPNNKIKVINGEPNHLYSTIEVSCPPGSHFSGGQEVINATCLPLPDPCYCRAAWETLDQYNLIYDFNCTDSKPVPCYDPTPTNGAMEVLSGTPFVISNVTVKVLCLHGLQFPDGTTEKTATCLPASTPYHVTGVWTPPFGPLKCEESVVCKDPKTPDNTVTSISGKPLAMGSRVEVTCNEGRHFPNGLSRVNVTCLGLPDPCMCRAAWQTFPGYNLMYSFNCTGGAPALQPPISVSEGRNTIQSSPEQESMTEEGEVIVANTDDVNPERGVMPENIKTPKQLPNHIPVDFVENSNTIDKTDNQILDIEQETTNIEINKEQTKSDDNSEEKLTDTTNENEGELQSFNENVNPIPQSIIEGVEEQEETNDFEGDSEITENPSLKDKEHLGNGEEVNEYDDVENRIDKYASVESPASNEGEIPEEIAEEDEEEEIRLTNAAEQNNTDETESELEPESEEHEKEIEVEETDNEEYSIVNTIRGEREQELEEVEDEEEIVMAEETVSNDDEEEQEEEEEEEEEESDSEEPSEEEWGTESNEEYHESQSEIEQTTGPAISLDESLPVNQHSMTYNVIEDSYEVLEGEQHTDAKTDSNGAYKEGEEYEEKEEGIDEEYDEYEEHEQEQEEHSQEEESNEEPEEEETVELPEEHETEEEEEQQQQSDEGTTEERLDSDSGEQLPDQLVDPPAPLHEIQTSPFFRNEDVVEIDEGEVDICTLRPDSGVGRQVHTRYFYDTTSGECTRFVYGGRGGNRNNFEDIYACIETCYRQRS